MMCRHLMPFVVLALFVALMALPEPAYAACPNKDLGTICKQHDIWLMPGVQGLLFVPAGEGIDPYYGAGLHLAIASWSHNNELFGPSHGELYFEAGLLTSSSADSTLGLFEGGFTLSLERNASRRWFIPFYGVGVGGTVNEDIPDAAYITPVGGLYVFWHPNAQITVRGAYHVPFDHLDEVRGARAQLITRISLW